MNRLPLCLALAALASVSLAGCSEVALTTPTAPLAEYLAQPQYARMFPEKADSFSLYRIDDQASLPEFGFHLAGERAIYRHGRKELEVIIYPDAGDDVMRQLTGGIMDSAKKSGSDLTRFRRNNGSYTYATAQNMNYRFLQRSGALIVFRHHRSVSPLQPTQDYLRQARLPGEPDRVVRQRPEDNQAVLIEG